MNAVHDPSVLDVKIVQKCCKCDSCPGKVGGVCHHKHQEQIPVVIVRTSAIVELEIQAKHFLISTQKNHSSNLEETQKKSALELAQLQSDVQNLEASLRAKQAEVKQSQIALAKQIKDIQVSTKTVINLTTELQTLQNEKTLLVTNEQNAYEKEVADAIAIIAAFDNAANKI